jgi:hypothetical protein
LGSAAAGAPPPVAVGINQTRPAALNQTRPARRDRARRPQVVASRDDQPLLAILPVTLMPTSP